MVGAWAVAMIRVSTIPGGNAGARVTVSRMSALARTPSAAVARLATLLGGGQASRFMVAGAIYTWVQQHMEYVPDDPDIEQVKSPEYLLWEIANYGRGSGDCDDWVTLMAALLLAAGLRPLAVLVAADGGKELNHVYLSIPTEIGWLAADGIHGEAFGWELSPFRIARREELAV